MKRKTDGFTLVELAIVIVIIAVLASITIFTYAKVQVNARDTTRANSTQALGEALEKYYGKNGEYPSCAQMTQSGSQVAALLGIEQSILLTPTASSGTTNSITGCSNLSAGAGSDVYAYVGDGTSTCTTGTACSNYTLQYRQEGTGGIIISVQAQHEAQSSPVSAPGAPVVSASVSGSTVTGTAAPTSCSVGTPQYRLHSSSTSTSTPGTWSGWGSWSSSQLTLPITNALQGYQYSFQAQARCYDGGNTSGESATSNTATAVRPISTPAAPTYAGPSSFTSNVEKIVNYVSYCPTGTSVLNGTYRTKAWTGGQWGPNPFGYLDSWENYSGVDKTVEYWGKYQCKSYWTASGYSSESYKSLVVHP
jgi:prepilin-type N-terminal cleavage/methylation domain-containing protein